MKTIRLFPFVIIMFIIPAYGFAKNVQDEVILTVSADGTTKEEAVKAALRSAIEQAYGTFVSANTTLLNDELVKDEIVTISSGNIKEYKEVSIANLPSGKIFATLRAVVSVSKLISYAQHKGAKVEFAGATFAMNMKMKELNKKNEAIAWDNLLQKLNQLLLNSFDYQLQIGNPTLGNKRLSRLPMDEQRVLRNSLGLTNEYLRYLRKKDNKTALPAGSYYNLPLYVRIKCNENMRIAMDLIVNTLQQLSLTGNEIREYETSKIPFKRYNIVWAFGKRKYKFIELSTRNVESIKEWLNNIRSLFWHGLKNFSIVDNLGEKICGTEFVGQHWGNKNGQNIYPGNYDGCYVNFYDVDRLEDYYHEARDVRYIPHSNRLPLYILVMRMNFCQDEARKIIKKEDLDKYVRFEIKINDIDRVLMK